MFHTAPTETFNFVIVITIIVNKISISIKEDTKMVKEEPWKVAVREIVEKNRWRKAPVLPVLRGIQDTFGYLPEDALRYAAEELGISIAQIYSTATFYHLFSLKPQGKYVIRICNNFVCHMKGNKKILRAISDYLGIGIGETTKDGLFTLLTTSCMGQCDRAPAMMINDRVYLNLTPEKAVEILKSYKEADSSGE